MLGGSAPEWKRNPSWQTKLSLTHPQGPEAQRYNNLCARGCQARTQCPDTAITSVCVSGSGQRTRRPTLSPSQSLRFRSGYRPTRYLTSSRDRHMYAGRGAEGLAFFAFFCATAKGESTIVNRESVVAGSSSHGSSCWAWGAGESLAVAPVAVRVRGGRDASGSVAVATHSYTITAHTIHTDRTHVLDTPDPIVLVITQLAPISLI